MRSTSGSRVFWLLISALLLSMILPIVASGQGRWHRYHGRTRTVVMYRYYPRPSGFYRTRYHYSRYHYYRPHVVYVPRGQYVRPYYGRYYRPYGYWYGPAHHRHNGRVRVNLRY